MPFRCRQKLSYCSTFVPFVEEEKTLETGMVVRQSVQSNKELPTTDVFELKNILDAGVAIEEVNSKVLSSKVINADDVIRKYTKQGVNNEVKQAI